MGAAAGKADDAAATRDALKKMSDDFEDFMKNGGDVAAFAKQVRDTLQRQQTEPQRVQMAIDVARTYMNMPDGDFGSFQNFIRDVFSGGVSDEEVNSLWDQVTQARKALVQQQISWSDTVTRLNGDTITDEDGKPTTLLDPTKAWFDNFGLRGGAEDTVKVNGVPMKRSDAIKDQSRKFINRAWKLGNGGVDLTPADIVRLMKQADRRIQNSSDPATRSRWQRSKDTLSKINDFFKDNLGASLIELLGLGGLIWQIFESSASCDPNQDTYHCMGVCQVANTEEKIAGQLRCLAGSPQSFAAACACQGNAGPFDPLGPSPNPFPTETSPDYLWSTDGHCNMINVTKPKSWWCEGATPAGASPQGPGSTSYAYQPAQNPSSVGSEVGKIVGDLANWGIKFLIWVVSHPHLFLIIIFGIAASPLLLRIFFFIFHLLGKVGKGVDSMSQNLQ